MTEEQAVEQAAEGAEQASDDQLKDMLKELNIKTPEELQGIKQASSEAGRLANMVGELRSEINELKSRPQETPQPQQQYDEYGNSDAVNLSAEIKKGVRDVLTEFAQQSTQAQQRLQQRRNYEVQRIMNDRHYPLLSEIWTKHLQNPSVQQRLVQKSIYDEYNDVRVEALDRLARNAGSKTAAQSTPTQGQVPHVEATQTGSPRVTEPDEKANKLKTVQENWTGSDQDISSVLDAVLPPGDLSSMR